MKIRSRSSSETKSILRFPGLAVMPAGSRLNQVTSKVRLTRPCRVISNTFAPRKLWVSFTSLSETKSRRVRAR